MNGWLNMYFSNVIIFPPGFLNDTFRQNGGHQTGCIQISTCKPARNVVLTAKSMFSRFPNPMKPDTTPYRGMGKALDTVVGLAAMWNASTLSAGRKVGNRLQAMVVPRCPECSLASLLAEI